MFLLNWYRQWLELKAEYKQPDICESCETLRQQNEFLRQDNDKILTRLLAPITTERAPEVVDNVTPIKRGHIPWNVRRQSLESEDRKRAQLARNAPKPVTADTELRDLEKEVLGAEQEREAKTGK